MAEKVGKLANLAGVLAAPCQRRRALLQHRERAISATATSLRRESRQIRQALYRKPLKAMWKLKVMLRRGWGRNS